MLQCIRPMSRSMCLVFTLVLLFSCCFSPALGGSNRWTALGPGGGPVNALVQHPTDPDTLYAAPAGNGVFKTTNGGESWFPINAGLGINNVTLIVIDQLDPDSLYAGNQGLYRSTNGGATWAACAALPASLRSLALDSQSHFIYAGTTSGVYRSTDGGATWTPRSSGLSISSYSSLNVGALAIDRGDPQILYCQATATVATTPTGGIGLKWGVFKSTNGGGNWRTIRGSGSTTIYSYSGLPRYFMTVDPLDSQVVFSGGEGTWGGVDRSTDAGQTWSTLSVDASAPVLAVHSTATNIVYVGTRQGLYKSTDGGDTWAVCSNFPQTSVTPNISAIALSPTDPDTLYVADIAKAVTANTAGQITMAGIWKSTNGGNTWQAANSGISSFRTGDISFSTTSLWATTSQGGIFSSSDSGGTWQARNTGLENSVNAGASGIVVYRVAATPGDPTVLYAATSAGLHKSTDSGAHWTRVGFSTYGATCVLVDPAAPLTVYAGEAYYGHVAKSTNGGSTWNTYSGTNCSSNQVVDLKMAPGGLRLYAVVFNNCSGARNLIKRSTDAGLTWALSNTGLPDVDVNRVAIDPNNADILVAATDDGVFRSTNQGSNWTRAGADLIGLQINDVMVASDGMLWAATDEIGVIFSDDDGTSWYCFNTGLYNLEALSLSFDPVQASRLYAGTGGGLYVLDLSCGPFVSDQPDSAMIASGGTATLQVVASGADSQYQWYEGTSGDTAHPVEGAQAADFTTPALSETTSFWVRVTNGCGGTDSDTAFVTVSRACSPPGISQQPASTTVAWGESAQLSVTADAGSPAFYTWYRGVPGDVRNPVPGGRSAELNTPALYGVADFWVRIVNRCDSIDSEAAAVTVGCPAPHPTTGPAADVLSNSARLTGAVEITSCNTRAHFEWGLSTSYGSVSPLLDLGSKPGTFDVSFVVSGLLPLTTYHFRLLADSGGQLSTGADQTFMTGTSCSAPVIVDEPDDVSITSGERATLTAAANLTPVTWQWYRGESGDTSKPIAGATSGSLITPPLVQDGLFWARATNACAAANTRTVHVTVNWTPEVWRSVGPDGGNITALAVYPADESIMYAATSGNGVFRSTDGGSNWEYRFDPGLWWGITAIAVAPTDPLVVYASNGSLYRSGDGGHTWVSCGCGTGIDQVLVDPSDAQVLYLRTSSGILKSTNGGSSCFAADSGLWSDASVIAINPQTPTTLYAGFSGGLWRSTDGGTTWSMSSDGLANTVKSIAFDPVQPSIMYAGSYAKIYKSTDGGATWAGMPGTLPSGFVYSVAPDPTRPSTIYVGMFESVVRTTDGGNNWSPVPVTHTYYPKFHALSNGKLFALTGLGLSVSTDGGENWVPSDSGLVAVPAASLSSHRHNPGTLATAGSVGIYITDDAGATWKMARPGNTTAVAHAPDNPSRLYAAAGYEGTVRSLDSGSTWDVLTDSTGGSYETAVATHRLGGRRLYVGTQGSSLFFSNDYGDTWNQVATAQNLYINCIEPDPFNDSRVFVGSTSGVFKSTDGGLTWTSSSLTDQSIYSLATDPSAQDVIYAGTADGSIYKSTNGGGIWTSLSAGLPGTRVRALVVDPANSAHVYAGLYGYGVGNGVYRSTDGGQNWAAYNSGLNCLNVLTLAFNNDSRILYAGTYGSVFAVKPGSNSAPLSNAGPDKTVKEAVPVLLDGTASSDPDGDNLTFAWTQVAGPAVVLANPASVTPTFTAPLYQAGQAALEFELVVSDGQSQGSPDRVVITVTPRSFADVPTTSIYYPWIERIFARGVTAGCAPGSYCPDMAVSRGQMAVFLERSKRGISFAPPAAEGTFTDVGTTHYAAAWIEQLFSDGITAGCGINIFCPETSVTRAQMAIFLLKTKYGAAYAPPDPVGNFVDVPTNHWAARWIEQLAREGITAGCSPNNYCPDMAVTRAQMAVFLSKTFGF